MCTHTPLSPPLSHTQVHTHTCTLQIRGHTHTGTHTQTHMSAHRMCTHTCTHHRQSQTHVRIHTYKYTVTLKRRPMCIFKQPWEYYIDEVLQEMPVISMKDYNVICGYRMPTTPSLVRTYTFDLQCYIALIEMRRALRLFYFFFFFLLICFVLFLFWWVTMLVFTAVGMESHV